MPVPYESGVAQEKVARKDCRVVNFTEQGLYQPTAILPLLRNHGKAIWESKKGHPVPIATCISVFFRQELSILHGQIWL